MKIPTFVRTAANALPRLVLVLCVFALSGIYGFAGVVTYTAEDLNTGSGSTRTNSDAAAASFDAAAGLLGNVSIITFESAPTGAFSSLSVAPGVTISGANVNSADQIVMDSPSFPSFSSVGGFNTTSGGKNYVDVFGGTLTFTFATPTQFFGAYLTGVQTNFFQDTVTFSDGSSQSINVPGAGTDCCDGGLDFVGFTDAGKSISSITITAGSSGWDDIGVDDVRYQSAVPEPSSLILLSAGGLGLLGMIRRKR